MDSPRGEKLDVDAGLVRGLALVVTVFVEVIGEIGTEFEFMKNEVEEGALFWLLLLNIGIIFFSDIIFIPSSTNDASFKFVVDPIGNRYFMLEF